jgi:hypothetical protein
MDGLDKQIQEICEKHKITQITWDGGNENGDGVNTIFDFQTNDLNDIIGFLQSESKDWGMISRMDFDKVSITFRNVRHDRV